MDQSEPPKSWEKAWTPNDLRRNSSCWSLAGDAGLLKYLQEFSQNLVAKTHTTQKAVDDLIEDLNSTSSAVNNVTNSFLSLANTQFVENRVYDDDETKSTAENENNVQEMQSKAEHDGETVDMVREALTISMDIIDTMFEAIEVPAVSDSEEEESSASAGHVVLRPVNPYTHRPLPVLIGSREFYEDDRVGLTELFSDEEENGMPTDAVVPSSESASDVEADYALSDRMKRRRMSSVSGSENSEPESEQLSGHIGHHKKQQRVAPPPSNMLGDESSHEVQSEQLPQNMGRLPNTFAAELAARLGVAPDTSQQNSPSPQEQQKDIGNMFLPPLEDDEILFGKNAKYSNGGGLFDDWNGSNEPESLWDHPEVKSSNINKESMPAERTFKKDTDENQPGVGQSKTDDLFSNDVEEDLFSTNIIRKPEKVSGTAAQAGSKKPLPTSNSKRIETKDDKAPAPLSESSGLFDDLWDTSDFDYNPTSSTVESSTHKEENLFTPANEKDLVKNNDVLDVSSTQSVPVKKPIGGVSVLGNMNVTASQLISRLHPGVKEPDDNDSHIKKATESASNKSSTSTQSGSTNSPVNPPSFPKLIQQKKPQSLFDDDNDSDEENFLFSSASSTGSRSRRSVDALSTEKKTETSTQQTLRKTSLFDSSSNQVDILSSDIANDDLFGMKTDSSGLQTEHIKHSPFPQENEIAGGLFDDWENDMYNASPKKEKISVGQSDTLKNTKVENIDIVASDQDSPSSLLFKKESSKNDIFSADISEDSILSGSDPSDGLFGKVDSEVKPFMSDRQSSKLNLFSADDFDEVDIFGEQVKSDISNSIRSNGVVLFPDKKTEKVIVAQSEPPAFPDNETTDIFSIPVEETISKEEMIIEDIEENGVNNEGKSDLIASSAKTLDIKKPVVPQKPAVSSYEPLLSNHQEHSPSADAVTDKAITTSPLTSSEHDTSLLPNVTNEDNIPNKGLQISKEVEDNIKVLKNNEDKIVPPSKPVPPRTLDIRKTTALEQDSSTGEDTFEDSSPVAVEGLLDVQQEKKKPLSSAEFGELLKGYSPPEDKMDGPLFSKKRTPEEDKTQPDEGVNTFIKTDAQLPARNLRQTLNIDPLALLPGAKPPKKTPHTEEAVGFDQPAADITATLHSAGKDRVKIQVKRRPQSRHARKEALRNSTISMDSDLEEAGVRVSPSRAEHPSRSSEQSPDEQKMAPGLQVEQSVLPRKKSSEVVNSTATGNSLLSPSTDEEDLFGVPSDLPSDYSEGNDLFKSVPVLSPTETSLKTVAGDKLSQDEIDPLDSLFSSNSVENDKGHFPEAVSHSVSKRTSLPEISDTLVEIGHQPQVYTDDNDLFSASNDVASSKSRFPSTNVQEHRKEVESSKLGTLFQYPEDDLFPSAKSDKYPGGYQTDLFGKDDLTSKDDLFSDSSWTTGGVGGESYPSIKPVSGKFPADDVSIQKGKEAGSNLQHHKEHTVSNEQLSNEKILTTDEKIVARGSLVLSDDEHEGLFSTNTKTNKKSQKTPKTNTKEKTTKNKLSENANLFSDDSPETDDLFSSIPHVSDKKSSGFKSNSTAGANKTDVTKRTTSKGIKSLFDDDEDDDLFGKTSLTSSYHSSTKTTSSGPLDRDEFFSTKSGIPKTKQKSQAESSNRIKKETIVVFEDPLTALKDT